MRHVLLCHCSWLRNVEKLSIKDFDPRLQECVTEMVKFLDKNSVAVQPYAVGGHVVRLSPVVDITYYVNIIAPDTWTTQDIVREAEEYVYNTPSREVRTFEFMEDI